MFTIIKQHTCIIKIKKFAFLKKCTKMHKKENILNNDFINITRASGWESVKLNARNLIIKKLILRMQRY